MYDAIADLVRKDEVIPVLAIVGGLLVGALWIVMSTVHSMVVATAKEKTKRELAAYVAEGTIDAEKAVAIINSGISASEEEAKAVVMMAGGKCKCA